MLGGSGVRGIRIAIPRSVEVLIKPGTKNRIAIVARRVMSEPPKWFCMRRCQCDGHMAACVTLIPKCIAVVQPSDSP